MYNGKIDSMKESIRNAALATLLSATSVHAETQPGYENHYGQGIQQKVELCAQRAKKLADGRIRIICPDYGDTNLDPAPTASVDRYIRDNYPNPDVIAAITDIQYRDKKLGNILTFTVRKIPEN